MVNVENLLNQSPTEIKKVIMEMYHNGKINTTITNEGPTEGDLEVLSSKLSYESGLPFDYIVERLLQIFEYDEYLKGICSDFEYLTKFSNGNLEEYIGKDVMNLLFDITNCWEYTYTKNPFGLTKFQNEFYLYCVSQKMIPSKFIEDFNNNESLKISDLMETISVILYKSENFFNNIK